MSAPPSNKRKADGFSPCPTLSKRPRIDECDSSFELSSYPVQNIATATGLMLPHAGGERLEMPAVHKKRLLMRSNNLTILSTTNETASRMLKEVVVKPLRILVLDGEHSHSSGVLSALEILRELTTRVGYDIGAHDVLPWEIFDLIVGSGDGGWVALMLGRLRMSIARTIEEYQRIHAQIHHTTLATSSEERSLLFNNLLRNLVERTSTSNNPDEPLLSPLSEAQCLTAVLAMASQNMTSPILFRTYSARNCHFIQNCTVWSAVRAATNVRSVFPEHTVDGQSYVAASRFGHCNPIFTALAEARMMFPDADISTLVSIGSGHPGPIAYSETVPGATMIKLANDAEQWSSQADKYFQTQGGNVYFRFSVDQGFQDYCLESGESYCAALAHTRAYCMRAEINESLNAAVSSLFSSRTSCQRERSTLSSTSCLDPRLIERMSKLRQIQSEDIHPIKEVLVAKEFRFQEVEVDSKPGKRFLVQYFTGSRARENRDRALQLNIQAMHPGLLHVFGKSLDYDNDWIVFYDGEARPAEQQLSSALLGSDTNAVVRQGISLIGNISSALQFLYDQFNVSGSAQLYNTSLKDFVVFAKFNGQYALALTPGHHESKEDSTVINVTLLQSVCSETLTQATIVAHRDKAIQNKQSFIHEVFSDDTDLSIQDPDSSHPVTLRPTLSHSIPSCQDGADQHTIKEGTDLRLYSWQKDTSNLHSLQSISEDFIESLPGAASIRKNIQLVTHLDGLDCSSILCPGYRRDDIRMSLSIQACAVFVYDTPQQGEVCRACGKEHFNNISTMHDIVSAPGLQWQGSETDRDGRVKYGSGCGPSREPNASFTISPPSPSAPCDQSDGIESATSQPEYNTASQTDTVRRVEISSPERVYPAQTELKSRRRYTCTVCDRSFTNSGHLTRHGYIHTGKKKYACPFPDCKMRCSRQDHLQQHYRTHLRAAPRQNMSKAQQATRVVAPAPPLSMASLDNASPPRSDAGRFAADRLPPLNTHFATRVPSLASDILSLSTSASAQHPQLPPIHVPPSPIDAANPIRLHIRRRPVCANCGTTETLLWRRGVAEENKDKLFCNACDL
ncbi:hypothetical protein DL96DRAFT_128881 [Flagelloscypha sp. PMI_526]|nr:hypothetical protein DL96DRAFT_128881 [Flagelloscypha sp. PMI_526]